MMGTRNDVWNTHLGSTSNNWAMHLLDHRMIECCQFDYMKSLEIKGRSIKLDVVYFELDVLVLFLGALCMYCWVLCL